MILLHVDNLDIARELAIYYKHQVSEHKNNVATHAELAATITSISSWSSATATATTASSNLCLVYLLTGSHVSTKHGSKDHDLAGRRSSVVRTFPGLSDDSNDGDDGDDGAYSAEGQNKTKKARSTPPMDETPPVSLPPNKETPVTLSPIEGGVGGTKELKLTLVLQDSAGSLSGDLGQYADTSWSLISPRNGAVIPKQSLGLGDATVSKREMSHKIQYLVDQQTVSVIPSNRVR